MYSQLCVLIFTWNIWPLKADGDLYQHRVVDIQSGRESSLEQYRGQALLVVNVASECGYTRSHYLQLQKLYDRLSPSGHFSVLAFPCHQFGKQEPGDNQDIWEFAQREYGATFPIFEKVDILGANVHPFWKHLITVSKVEPEWNFFKYLISHDGKVLATFSPQISVDKIVGTIQDAVDKAQENAAPSLEDAKTEL
eukprot:maker-scaffold368_size193847-snap-gene-0.43 protein:Tk10009 transcript:maker-scaffold368_size193847-snap-gene-0.43-mRNA-1 annotation:"glutathione peroxidase 7"